MDTLAFGYILPTTGRIRDFDPLETCVARRTTKKIAGHFMADDFLHTFITVLKFHLTRSGSCPIPE